MKNLVTCLVAATAVSVASPAWAEEDPTIRLAHSTWIGFGPFYVAKEKGFFEAAGADVDPIIIEASSDAIAAVMGGQLEAVSSTVDNFALFAGNGVPLSIVFATDESAGGDGIVAREEIDGVAGLAGKTVAAQQGSVSQFLLSQALDAEGLSLSDVNLIDMKSGDAGAAFVAGQVDAAVTWEPWLSRADDTEFGKILIDTEAMPGLIIGAVALRPDFIEAHPEAVQGMVTGYFDAIDFIRENPKEAKEIMARNLNMTPESLEASWGDINLLGRAENRALFSTAGSASPIADLAQAAGDFYQRIGVLNTVANGTDIVDGEFVND